MLGLLAWYQLLLDVVNYGWSSGFNTTFRFSFGSDFSSLAYSAGVFAPSVEVVVVGLVCCSIIDINPGKSRLQTGFVTWGAWAILVAAFVLFCVDEFFSATITLRGVTAIQHASRHDVGITAYDESNLVLACVFGMCVLILSLWLRNKQRTSLFSILSMMTLLIGVGTALVVDGLIVPARYPFIAETVFTRNLEKVVLAVLVTCVPAAVYGWRYAIADRTVLECPKAFGSGNTIDWLEFVAVMGLFSSSCLSFYSYSYNPMKPWLIDLFRFDGAEFFRYALPIVCSGFAMGRWVKMHWSSAIVAPDCVYCHVSLATFFKALLFAQCWILAFSILTAWLVTRSSLLTLIPFFFPN